MVSCTVDYDMKPANINEPDRIVVNSFLNPDKPVRVYFFTVNRTDAGFAYNAAKNLQVRLTENGDVLFDGLCADSVLNLDYHPKESAKYRIEVSLSDHEPVWAETTIPAAIACKVRAERFNYNEMKYFLSGFEGNYTETNSSLYISAYGVVNNDTLLECSDLYATNILIDKINRSNGIEVKDKDIGSAYYENFMRVRNMNIPLLDSILFISYVNGGYYDYNLSEYVGFDIKYTLVKVITAGPEYDRYYRTFYRQTVNVVYDDDISAIVYQPIQVYCNINNGLGIFAGLSESNYYFEIPEEERTPYNN
ncbi:MAG: DUF4249 domain-containing protein [Tannerella sp.]|nr:DUF4249 domain-containing protein [Tannerella sp.]